MDLFVELPNGTTKLVPVSLNCSLRAATQSTVIRAGMAPVASKLSEFSLAKKTDNPSQLVDVNWLDEGLRVKDQLGGDSGSLNLILLKKYFSVNTDLSVLSSSAVLLKHIYSQFRRAYVSGLYKCVQSEAVTLSALIARAEFSLSELRPGSLQKTGRLEDILPPVFVNTPDMEKSILTALGSVAKLSERQAQQRFINTVRNSDTFGLSLHTITLVQIGGDRREALLGVGTQHISVIEKPNLHVLMQWKTRDLTIHSFNDTTFTMNYGSETVTVVTKQGHMISAFLSGMSGALEPAEQIPVISKRPMNHGMSVGGIENGLGEIGNRTSTHIKSVGKQVKQYEVQLLKSRPVAPPRPFPRGPAGKPSRVPKPRHAPLRSTQSVPIQPGANPGLPSSLIQPRGVASRGAPANGFGGGEGAVYEVPVQRKQEGGEKKNAKTNSPCHKSEEAHYEVGDSNEGVPLQSAKKFRPLPPPPLKKLPLKKKPLLPISQNSEGEKCLLQNGGLKTHKSDSDVPTENGARDSPESPIYDELVPAPEYDFPTPLVPRDRRSCAVKRKSQVSVSPNPITPTQFSNPFSPPPPSSPAPPPPSETMERATVKIPRMSMSHTPAPQTPAPQIPAPQTPAPQTPAPEPPIYDTLTMEDDMKEIEDIFGSKDLLMKVKFSCDTNPIYDTLAATKVKTSLSTSDVTYHSFTLERQKKRKIAPPKSVSQPQVMASSPAPPPPLPSSSPPLSSPHDYENSELLSLLLKEPSLLHHPMQNGVSSTGASEPKIEKPRKMTPSPPLVTVRVGEQTTNASKSKETAPKLPHLPVPNSAPSFGYSRLEHFNNKTHSPVQPSVDQAKSGTTDDEEHEYAEVDHKAPRTTKHGRKKLKSWLSVQEASSAPPVPPMRGTEAEIKKIGPPKPPRARMRWEKKVEKGESKSHKAMKNNDVLRDYSSLLKEFRMFHVKLPTGLIHTELANVKSEVGKLVKRLCVLLCVNEEDHTHYSLYVEGTPFTQLAEMTEDEEGGEESGMFRRLRQKSPSRLDLFSNSNKSFAVLSERSTNPILLDPSLSFKSQGITTTRILALRPQTMLPHKLTRFQIRVPDWVRFHQCWLSVVQGNLMATQADAIKLAALQYQAYFLDRTELNSVIGFCRSSDFLPHDFANVKGIEEKVFAEQQRLKGYTRLHAQDSYIFTACSLPTYNTIFFHCLEAKRKLLRIGNTKLVPVLIGMGPEGVVRADYKTKEIMDVWAYQVLKNWGYTEQTFILEFDDRTYPLKTIQGRWMNALVDFHIEAILGNMTIPPTTHQQVRDANALEEVVPIPHNRDNIDEIYSDLLSVRVQAQQWLAETGNKPSSSPTTSPPHSPPTPPTPSSAPLSPSMIHATSIPPKHQEDSNQVPISPGVYEEVDFDPSPRTIGFYDVLRKENKDDKMYYLPPDS